jgi:hypothetical protein
MAHALTHRNIGNNRTDDGDTADHENMQQHAVVNHELMRSRYGGFHFGSALFGWLVATGMSAILIALLGAAGSAVAVSTVDKVTSQTTSTVGFFSGILLLIALAIAYYAGGYVAGRLSRFDGARQGLGVWLIGILVTLILGGIGAAVGSKFNILQQLNLPHLPINQGSFTKGGLIASIAAVIITLLAAIIGGKAGEAFHKKVDATGEVGTVDL